MHYLSALAAPIFLVNRTPWPFIPPAKSQQNRYCRLISAGLLLFLFLLTPGAVPAQQTTGEARLSVDVLSLDEGADSTAITVTATLRQAATADTTITLALPATRPTSSALLPNLTVATQGANNDTTDYSTTFGATHTISISNGSDSATTTFNIDPSTDTTTEGTETIIITGTGTGLSVTPTEVYLEDGPYVAFSSMIDTQVEYYSTDVGTITLPTATNNVVGSVTYAVTSDPATPTHGLTHTQADNTTPGTLTGTTAGSASTTRYTITATDDMGTTSDTTDDKTATTIVSVNVIEDQCSTPTGWHPGGATPSDELITDCNILLAAKASFVANSNPSTYTPNWATDTDIASWEKVTLLNGTERVIRLEIKPESSHPLLPTTPVNLKGPIPPVLGGLTSLQKLQFFRTRWLSGKIPPELGSLSSLAELDLGENKLSGAIPRELGGLTNLKKLLLSYNQLSGAIPKELATLTNLEHLTLTRNALSGSIPWELGKLSALRDLNLNENQINGPIPPRWDRMTSLRVFNLRWLNHDSSTNTPKSVTAGPVPYLNSTNLTMLELESTNRTGSLPWELKVLTSLEKIFLENNQLSGTIPTELGDLTALENISLKNNQLSGTIPTELGDLTALTTLYLENNQLSGSIPTQLGNLTALRELRLNNNQLSGSIPTQLGNLTVATFKILFLNNNQLSGAIPTQLGNLTALIDLHLNNNQLSGSIPTELGNLTALRDLRLNDNQLSGTIPTQLGNLADLYWLYLNGNQLSGSIPTELGNLTSLDHLRLDDNQLSGEIPTQLGNLTNLQWLLLSYNALSGAVPSKLGDLTRLAFFYLHENQLEDPLPATFTKLTGLGGFLFDYNESSCLSTGLDDEWYDNRSFFSGYQDAVEVHCAYSQPSAPTLTAGATSLTLTWNAYTSTHTDDTSDPSPSFTVSDYEVQYRQGTTRRWTTVPHDSTHPTTGTSYQITGLEYGQPYQTRYRARAPHATETGRFYGTRWSAASTLVPGVSLTADNITTTSAALNIHDWSKAWRHKNGHHEAPCRAPSIPSGTATDTLTNLTPGTTYTYTAYSDGAGASINAGATPASSHCSAEQALATVTFKTALPRRVVSDPDPPPDDDGPTDTPPTSSLENPKDGSTVSGVDIIRGWSFAEEDGVRIASVELYIDRQRVASIPCCSARLDVAEAYPRFPEATHSGWGITWNWGNLTAGEHTVQVVATSTSGGRWKSERSTVTVVKPGGSPYADWFSLAEAEAELDNEHLVLDGVVLRDKETQEEHEVVARYAWQEEAQGVRLVASRTLEMARVQPVGLERLLAGALRWGWGLLSPGSVTATEGITAVYEAPKDREPVAGIGIIRGWAFTDDVTDAIDTVTVRIDDTLQESMPCCSERMDVAREYPEQTNAERSGWGMVFNYGNLPEGEHTISVHMTTEAGLERAPATRTVTVSQLGGYAFIDRFDLSEATAEIVGEEIILSGVEVRDKESRAWQTIDVHLQWSAAAQHLVIVDSKIAP